MSAQTINPTCPASPAGRPHRWLAYQQPVLTRLARWTCEPCGLEVTARADASGCAPDLHWLARQQLAIAAAAAAADPSDVSPFIEPPVYRRSIAEVESEAA